MAIIFPSHQLLAFSKSDIIFLRKKKITFQNFNKVFILALGFSCKFNAHVNGKSLLKTVIQAFVCCLFEVELMGGKLRTLISSRQVTQETPSFESFGKVCVCVTLIPVTHFRCRGGTAVDQ